MKLCRDQVAKAIADHEMLAPGERVLVAVSGGKDSLALWDLLLRPGLRGGRALPRPRHRRVQRGVAPRRARAFAARAGSGAPGDLPPRRARLRRADCARRPPGACPARRAACRSGTSSTRPRIDGGYDVVATGHNLDDEAAVLFGNTLRWDLDYLARQLPVLPARDGFPRKVKPLVRLTERETAAYCVVRGIDYLVEECPMAAGNQHLGYKAALNAVEERSPGTKAAFYLGFLDRMAPMLAGRSLAGRQNGLQLVRSLWRARPPGRSAPSAAWSSGPAPTSLCRSSSSAGAVPAMTTDGGSVFAVRRQGARARHQGPPLPGHPQGGRRVPHPCRLLPPRRAHRPARGDGREGEPRGAPYTVLRPTLEDFVVEMPRGAQVIYPKDLGPILMLADIGPGDRVLESGVGSGALSMTMLRAGAEIVGYELREDFANRARANVRSFLGADVLDRYRVELRDCYEGIDEEAMDRVVLDLPEPWRVVPHARGRAARRRDPRRLHALDHAGQPAQGGAGPLWRLAGARERSRCCTGPGTSRARPCAPTTGWWPTRASSRQPATSGLTGPPAKLGRSDVPMAPRRAPSCVRW